MNLVKSILQKPFLLNYTIVRGIAATPVARIKEIEVVQEKDTLVVRGKTVSSGRESLLIEEVNTCAKDGKKFCPECTLGLEIKHTDVLILSQYVRADGCMLPQRVTGLCKRQQRKIGVMVTMAHKAGLLSNLKPANSKRDPTKRKGYRKFNTYFDESTIKLPRPIYKC